MTEYRYTLLPPFAQEGEKVTRQEREEFVRRAILDDPFAGENSHVNDETVEKIVDKWEEEVR